MLVGGVAKIMVRTRLADGLADDGRASGAADNALDVGYPQGDGRPVVVAERHGVGAAEFGVFEQAGGARHARQFEQPEVVFHLGDVGGLGLVGAFHFVDDAVFGVVEVNFARHAAAVVAVGEREFDFGVTVGAVGVGSLADELALSHHLRAGLHADFVGVEPELARAKMVVGDEGGGDGHGVCGFRIV